MARTASATQRIEAAPGPIYDLVADLARMGQWSPEATGAVGAPRRVVAGDRFIGSNRRGPVRWWTVCTVLRAERGRVLEFDVDAGPLSISRWTYTFHPLADGGTRVTETWLDRRDGLVGLPVRAAGRLLIPGDRAEHNRANIRITLQRLKAAAEAGAGQDD